jgi:CubicO group peptidase (beta-lactamase class C family)
MKKLHLPIILFVLSFTIIFSSCRKNDDSTPEPSPVTDKRNDQLNALLANYKSNTTAPALLASVFKPGTNLNWLGSIGKANLASNESVTVNHKFRAASVTKMLTGVSIMILSEENKLSIDDKISKYLSESLMNKIRAKIPEADAITIKNLLNHTSTLEDYTGSIEFVNYWGANPTNTSRDSVINIGISLSPVGTFGSFNYSNTGYNLLGIIIETVSNQTYHSFVKERIFNKLDMKVSYFPTDDKIRPPFVSQYFKPQNDYIDVTDGSHNWANATGDVISTIGDLQKFIQGLVQNKLISPQSLATMKQEAVPSEIFGFEKESYGLGLIISENPSFFGHSGDLYGIHTTVYYVPDLDAYIVCASSGEDEAANLTGAIYEWIQKNDK